MIIKDGTRLYVNITNACDVTCPFCCMYSGNKNDSFMDFDTFKSIVDGCEGDIELQLEGGNQLSIDFSCYSFSMLYLNQI